MGVHKINHARNAAQLTVIAAHPAATKMSVARSLCSPISSRRFLASSVVIEKTPELVAISMSEQNCGFLFLMP